ncbi:hypothetical protein K7432_008673 [Basidiobolus ranarum]|uniref:NmrA-like domain-containing protein n=1 Tax=Basidiobolus ranarum TaxID=34480 RepID=A0ABR2WRG9_9FUNG
MSSQKLIAVIGATGVQGGSAVRALLRNGEFRIRGLTRNPDSPAAQKLSKEGVEMVKCDINNPSELDSAFEGAYGVFVTTDTMESYKLHKPELEIVQGHNIADAAKKANVQHLVHSSLLDSLTISGGKYSQVHHFTNKNAIEKYMKQLGLPMTVLIYGFYMSNTITGGLPTRKADDGALELLFPVPDDTRLAPLDTIVDSGECVAKCFLNPTQTIGKTYFLGCEEITIKEFASIMEKVSGAPVRAVQIPEDQLPNYHLYSLAPIAEMFKFWHDFGYFGGADVKESQEFFGFTDFESYLRREGWNSATL